jgi:hypothetical protein
MPSSATAQTKKFKQDKMPARQNKAGVQITAASKDEAALRGERVHYYYYYYYDQQCGSTV